MCPLKEAARIAPNAFACDQYTFQQLDDLADTFAKNICSHDIVAMRLSPSPTAIALFFAVWRQNGSICPLSLRLPEAQIASCLNRSNASLYIDASGWKKYPQTAVLQEPSSLLFTSGTTSLPKVAVLSFTHLLNNAKSAIAAVDLRPGDRWLLNLPLYHVGGIGIILRSVLAKAHIVLNPNDPTITHSSCVPTHLYRATPIYKNLKCLLIGGAPLSSYPQKLPCYLTYGLTEMGSMVCARLRPPLFHRHFDLGPPLSGKELRLAPDGEILLRGDCLFQGYWEEGEIKKFYTESDSRVGSCQGGFQNLSQAQSGSKQLNFLSLSVQTGHKFRGCPTPAEPILQSRAVYLDGGWFATKDMGRITDTGGLIVLGRKDRQFISGGENIQPEEIEKALLALPEVLEAAVIPIADPEFGKRPAAIVQTSLRDPAYLRSALSDRLAPFKIPIRFAFVDQMPKTGLKIDFHMIHKIFN